MQQLGFTPGEGVVWCGGAGCSSCWQLGLCWLIDSPFLPHLQVFAATQDGYNLSKEELVTLRRAKHGTKKETMEECRDG